MKYFKNASFYIVLILVIFILIAIISNNETPDEKAYTDLVKAVHAKTVDKITMEGSKALVEFKDEHNKKYIVYIPDLTSFMQEISEPIRNGELSFKATPPPTPPWW
ncbi:MAG TPA: ATP-dependent metallopeptidase FtsH/Yme1/Tma family protein, partial [Clostridia bacterium]